jgi:hypothetical protein
MPHPLVEQLRFTRSELQRALAGVTDDEARRRFMPMNCISWIVGHLAAQEQRYWLLGGQGRMILPDLNDQMGFGAPASTPPLDEMWAAWHAVTEAADPWLDTLTSEKLQIHPEINGNRAPESFGTLMRRTTYHYWYHIGESQAIRQLLGHTNLPIFVGDIQTGGPYRPE